MNRIFKVIWSKTKHCYIVVSEYAKANTKAVHTGLRTTAAAAAVAAMLLAPVNYNYAWAADTVTVEEADTSTTTQQTQTVYTTDGADKTFATKADAAVQDAGVVKADKKIGENVTALGKGLYDETAARIGADAAQDKVIQKVNENLVQSVNTINKNVADGFTALNTADANEAKARTDADAAEKAAREAGDTTLDTRITKVKEYLENQTSDKYVSKADAAVQDGAIVKAANTIGDNVTKLDAALASETAARIGADKAQDKVIQQVNQNMVDGFNTINKNMADGFTALNQADANEAAAREAADVEEKAGRVAADTKLVEAVNSGLSLSNDNVLQKNTTIIDAQGNVTTSKTGANEMILNKGKDTQITLNENGIKIGTNSTVVDKNGVYTGGDTYSEAKAAMSAGGSIKGADGKFTVNSNGGVKAADGKITLNSDGSVKAADGKFTVNSNGGVKAADGKITLNSDGSVKAADGKFTVNSNGAVTAADGKFTVDSNGAVKAANGNTTIDSNGNLKTAGTLSAADGSFKVDSNGKITSTGLDAGNGTIQTTGTVKAGDVQTVTLETTGNATIGGGLTVDKNLTVNGTFDAKTLSSTVDANNYTTINGGKTQSMNLKMDAAPGETKASASTFDENGSNTWAKDDDSIGRSTVTADGISQRLSNTGDNPTVYAERTMSQGTDNKYSMVDTVKDGDKTNVASQSATESRDVVTAANGNTSTFRQRVDAILQELKNADGGTLTKVEQTDTAITSQIGDGSAIKSVMNANGIANTATGKSITNDAADIINKGTNSVTNQVGSNKVVVDTTGVKSAYGDNTYTTWNAEGITNSTDGNMTNTVGGNKSETVTGTSTETVTGKKTENYNGGLETTVTGEEKHTVNGSQTNAITGNQTNIIDGSQTTTVTGDSSLTAENINNTAKNKITNKALDVETDAASSIVSKVSNDYGSNTSTQTSNETKEAMSQADGKTASYLRGAAEEKSQLIDGSKKTTIDTIAGQTNTNITEGKNVSNSLQKADQIASSVTDGTNTTVVNQNAGSIASSITDGTKVNNSNNTVDKSEQLIKASDTQYSATSKTATKMEDALVSGSSVIDVTKNLDDAANPFIGSAVTDGTNSTGVTQTAKDITNTAEKGTIANNAKDIINNATENMTTTVGGEMKTTVTGKVTEDYKSDLDTKVGGNETHAVTGNQTVTVSKDRTVNVKGTETENFNAQVTNVKTDQRTSVGRNQTNIVAGNQQNTVSGSKTETVKGSVTEKYGSQATTVDGNQSNTVKGTLTETVTGDVTEDYKANLSTTVGGKQTTTVTGDSSLTAKNINNKATKALTNEAETITNKASESVTTQIGDGTAVKSEMTADGITNTAEGGTIYNKSKDILNEVSGDILNFADGEIGNAATKITNLTGDNTVTSDTNGTTFENKAHSTTVKEGTITKTTISGNTITTGEAVMDYADVMKDLGVRGNAAVDGNTTLGKKDADTTLTVNSKSTFKDTVKMEKTLEVDRTSNFNDKVTVTKGGLNVTGGTTTDTLHVTSTSTFDSTATFKDIVTMEKDLSVGGNATVAGDVTANSYKVRDKTYINANGINANGQKITNVAAGTEDSDAANYGQLRKVETRVDGVENRVTNVENRVDKMDSRIDKVGANAAAMANLHPLEFDEDSKWNVAAAVGNYKGETATAVGAFYRPNEDVMFNLSTTFGNDENMVGGGLSLRLGKGGNREKDKKLKAAIVENNDLRAKVNDLTARMDALLSVINPNMSKEFPDVPENHWAYEAVTRLAGNDIVQGYEDGKFHGERTMTRYEMAELIYNALSRGAKAEKKLVEEFKPELQAMAAQKQAK